MAVRHDSVQRKYSAMMQAPLYAFSSSLILLPFELVPRLAFDAGRPVMQRCSTPTPTPTPTHNIGLHCTVIN
jgi:hypothetical protein